jgi:hypothetical protein
MNKKEQIQLAKAIEYILGVSYSPTVRGMAF